MFAGKGRKRKTKQHCESQLSERKSREGLKKKSKEGGNGMFLKIQEKKKRAVAGLQEKEE